MKFDARTSEGMVGRLESLEKSVATGEISKAKAAGVAGTCGVMLSMQKMVAAGWNGSLSGKPLNGYRPPKAWTEEELKAARRALASLRRTIRPKRKEKPRGTRREAK